MGLQDIPINLGTPIQAAENFSKLTFYDAYIWTMGACYGHLVGLII